MTDLMEEQIDIDDLELPSQLPVLPLKDTVVFPDSVLPLAIGQERSVRLVEDVVSGNRLIALVASKDRELEQPGWDDLYEIGTAAVVQKMIRVPDGSLRILVQGISRIRLLDRLQDEPYLVGRFAEVEDVYEESPETQALSQNVQNLFARLIGLVPYLPEELALAAANVDDPSALCHLVASTLRLKTEEKQQLLELDDVEKRLRGGARDPEPRARGRRARLEDPEPGQSEMESSQREYFLRQQLKAIQEELGEGDPEQAEIKELRDRANEVQLPEEARKAVDRELARLEKLPAASAEYGVIRTYLEWILSLPWDKESQDNLDLVQARKVLDEDHYDLDKVKERILEYLAVSKLKEGDLSGPILCFVGPPGVGKTSLGPVDRADAWPEVRAHLGRRRPRRGRDPRPPAHVHRRHARDDHPRPAGRRDEEPGLPDRRDRQDGRRLAWRPGERDARGARSRAALDLPRPLPRPSVRPLEGALHLHREPARDDPAAAPRPHGRDPASPATPRKRSSGSPRSTSSPSS